MTMKTSRAVLATVLLQLIVRSTHAFHPPTSPLLFNKRQADRGSLQLTNRRRGRTASACLQPLVPALSGVACGVTLVAFLPYSLSFLAQALTEVKKVAALLPDVLEWPAVAVGYLYVISLYWQGMRVVCVSIGSLLLRESGSLTQ
ncbi:unnamed protein product [Vitrella brassicaformis CCMP3155]|uniref:Uncharacterized protein n=2 Tax=Vitrella brassicaformis TaxID=1169539 RepID=A0A0G4EDB2_VITBC|nr:unnamed protein product [Vitrella brassicaformis CCMP3155]|eukprot:CEL93333.1 unnamed protein product [Vitrella brassicaformis CCMP3155]